MLFRSGAEYVAVDGVRNLAHPASAPRLVAAALEHFGRLDSAVAFSGLIVTGRFLQSTTDDLQKVYDGCMVAPYQFLQAVLPPMIEAGAGQVLVITSASGARPTPGAPLYSAMRAGANHLVPPAPAAIATAENLARGTDASQDQHYRALCRTHQAPRKAR